MQLLEQKLYSIDELDGPKRRGRTALHRAAWKGRQQAISVLKKYGAKEDVKCLSLTALDCLIDGKHLDCISLLFDSNHVSFSILSRLVWEGDLDTLDKLLQLDPSLINKLDDQENLLHHLSIQEPSSINLDTIKWLIDKGININQADKRGQTPLHKAIGKRNIQLSQLLIENGADLWIPDSFGDTPIHWMLWNGFPERIWQGQQAELEEKLKTYALQISLKMAVWGVKAWVFKQQTSQQAQSYFNQVKDWLPSLPTVKLPNSDALKKTE